MNVNATGS